MKDLLHEFFDSNEHSFNLFEDNTSKNEAKANLLTYLTGSPDADCFRSSAGENQILEDIESDPELKQKLVYTNQALTVMGFSQLGDLCNLTQSELKKTIDCAHSLVKQRQTDIEFRKKHEAEVLKYKNELMIVEKKLELAQRDNVQLKRQLGKAENELLEMKQRVKENLTNRKSSKEDYRQLVNKMEQKVTQITHEMRKKENSLAKIQELYRSKVKDAAPYRNGFDVVSRVASESMDLLYSHAKDCEELAVHNFAVMLREGYERTQGKLVEENSQLKECLKLLQDEIASILSELVKKVRTKLPENETKCLEAIHIKPIIFKTSVATMLSDIYQIVRENICRIRDAVETVINLAV
eukprot:TRINITY_DN6312_c0_g1_i2.p1 TRINITY_DN6312_c0_g1~~TRINITY_DN6312_c0_g1_i2.p1  ORF type:complete len:354 (-),score=102.02 TRINITY_DN6312_c0_g1_i2:62-1123(-)